MMESIPAAGWAALTAVAGALAGFVSTRGKNRADAASALTTSAVAIVNELQEEVHRLQGRIDLIETEIDDCERRYKALQERMDGIG